MVALKYYANCIRWFVSLSFAISRIEFLSSSKVYVDLYSAIFPQSAWNALRHGSHSFTCKLYHSCLYSPAAEPHRPLAGTHFTVSRRVEGWVDLSGWLHTEIKYSVSFHFYSVMLCQNEVTAVVCPSIHLSVSLEYTSIVPYNTIDKHRSRKRRTIAQVLGTRVFMSTILSKFERGYPNVGVIWRWGIFSSAIFDQYRAISQNACNHGHGNHGTLLETRVHWTLTNAAISSDFK